MTSAIDVDQQCVACSALACSREAMPTPACCKHYGFARMARPRDGVPTCTCTELWMLRWLIRVPRRRHSLEQVRRACLGCISATTLRDVTRFGTCSTSHRTRS
jgi:hypothetical protein